MPDHVVTPDGTEWVVGRRWLPRPPRWVGSEITEWRRHKDAPLAPRLDDPSAPGYDEMWDESAAAKQRRSDWWEGIAHLGDIPDVGGGVLLVMVLVGLAVVVAIGLVVFVLPAVIFVVDLLFVLVVAGLALLARVLFGRPWIVVARSDAYLYEWAVVGWKASGAAIGLVKRAIARGESLDALRLRLL